MEMGITKFMKQNHIIIFLTIFILAFLLRFSRLGHESLSQDEFHTIDTIIHNLFFEADIHPPFYYVLLKPWTLLFGISPIAIRSLSLLFDMISLLVIYRLAKHLFDEKAAIYSSFFFAVSGFFIFHSTDAKSYSLFLMLALLSTYRFILLSEKTTTLDAVIYMLFSGMMIYTHYHAFLILFSQAAYVAALYLRGKKDFSFRRSVSLLALIVIVSFSFVPYAHNFISQADHISSIDIYGPLDISWSVKNMILDWNNYVSQAFFPLYAAWMLLIFVYAYKKMPRKKVILLFSWFFIPLLAATLISVFFTNIFRFSRFFIGIVPAYFIMAGFFMSKVKGWLKILVISLILLNTLLFHVGFMNTHYKNMWEEPSKFVSSYSEEKYQIIVLDYDYMKESFSYYFKQDNAVYLMDYEGNESVSGEIWSFSCSSDLIHEDEDIEKIDLGKDILLIYLDYDEYKECFEYYFGYIETKYGQKSVIYSYCNEQKTISGWECIPGQIILYEKRYE